MTDFWTPERIEKLTHWWNVEGLSANAIAERWGVTSNTISGKVDRLNLHSRKAPPVCWTTRERVIREVQANDGTAADAARILGVGMDTILKSSAKLGLRFPPRNGYGVIGAQRRPGAVKCPKSPPPDRKSIPGVRQAPAAVETVSDAHVAAYEAKRRANGALPFIEAPSIGRCKMFLEGESGVHGLQCAAPVPVCESWCGVHRAVVSA